MLEPLAAQSGTNDLDVLAGLLERLAPFLAVPALDHLRPRGTEPHPEAPVREQVERRGCHRRVRRRAARNLHDRRAQRDPVRERAKPGERCDRVGSPRFGRPRRLVAEPLGLAGELDQLERVGARLRVSHVEAEPHECDANAMTRLEQVRKFMAERVLPNEQLLNREDAGSDELVARLRDEVRELGLWAPHVPPEAGGTGTGILDYAYFNEYIGRSLSGQLVFGCQAPDAGNAEILHMFGIPSRRSAGWLRSSAARSGRSSR